MNDSTNNESTLQNQLTTLPVQPGVYLFKNAQGDILYVGKAKLLRSRVQSYFRPLGPLDPAKRTMIPKIANIETIVTDNENEALILEANLIRQHRPPYNVVLTDDKYYLFIKITTTEDWPRIFPVRKLKNDGNRYFGPYSSARAVRQTLKLLRRIFPYRAEKDSPNDIIFPHPLFSRSEKSAPRSLGEVGLDERPTPSTSSTARSIGASSPSAQRSPHSLPPKLTPAEDRGPLRDEYQDHIRNIIRFLKGDRQKILDTLQEGMKQASADKKYERAAIFRDQYQAIERLEGFQKVFLPRPESFDVISIVTEASRSAANVLSIRKGKLLDKNTFLLKHQRATNPGDILRQFLLQYYRDAQDIPPTIFIPDELPDTAPIAEWINKEHPPLIATPQRGKKRQLMTMGQLNAQQLLALETAAFAQDARLKRALDELFKVVGISPASAAGNPPQRRVETYDISNIQGRQATGSMVVFIEGQPEKSQYRKFRIKVGDTPNDYAMLQEVLTRRFSHRHTDWKKPDLILIDGGKGQLNSARKIMSELAIDIPLASIAKREEILFFYEYSANENWPRQGTQANFGGSEGGDRRAEGPPARRAGEEAPTERAVRGVPADGQFKAGKIKEVRLPYDSDALYLIQRMRDEAHRFGVTYHRLLRSKHSQRSVLDEIPGIGPTTKKQLLNHFGSLKNIRAATDEELTRVVGPAKTTTLRNFL
jgi:excinuclease ABC subunit C